MSLPFTIFLVLLVTTASAARSSPIPACASSTAARVTVSRDVIMCGDEVTVTVPLSDAVAALRSSSKATAAPSDNIAPSCSAGTTADCSSNYNSNSNSSDVPRHPPLAEYEQKLVVCVWAVSSRLPSTTFVSLTGSVCSEAVAVPAAAVLVSGSASSSSVTVGPFVVDAAPSASQLLLTVHVYNASDYYVKHFGRIAESSETIVEQPDHVSNGNDNNTARDKNNTNNNNNNNLLARCLLPIQHSWRSRLPYQIPQLILKRLTGFPVPPHQAEVVQIDTSSISQNTQKQLAVRIKDVAPAERCNCITWALWSADAMPADPPLFRSGEENLTLPLAASYRGCDLRPVSLHEASREQSYRNGNIYGDPVGGTAKSSTSLFMLSVHNGCSGDAPVNVRVALTRDGKDAEQIEAENAKKTDKNQGKSGWGTFFDVVELIFEIIGAFA